MIKVLNTKGMDKMLREFKFKTKEVKEEFRERERYRKPSELKQEKRKLRKWKINIAKQQGV